MDEIIIGVIAGLTSGGVVSALFDYLLRRRTALLEAKVRDEFEKALLVFQAGRSWKERSVSELLGPVVIQLDRSKRAFDRYSGDNLYLEAKVMGEANRTNRDLLLERPHLIPPHLLNDAALLIEHYDVWLEQFDSIRGGKVPDLNQKFVFAGPRGYPFPRPAEKRIREAYSSLWKELYG